MQLRVAQTILFGRFGPSPNPINSTIQVDVRIDNASGIWGWSLPDVSWNSSVMQLLAVQEGGFLANNSVGGSTSFIGDSPDLFDNVNGVLNGGLSEVIRAEATSTSSSGVLATLWFNVTGSGTTDIDLSGATVYADSTDDAGASVSSNNATLTVETPPPIFSDGFESGDFSNWDTYFGNPPSVMPTISTAQAHTGNCSVYFPAKPAYKYAFLTKSVLAQSSLDFRFYMNLADISGSGYFTLAEVDSQSGDYIRPMLNLAANQCRIDYYNCTSHTHYYTYSQTVNVTANTWFSLEIALTSNSFTLYYNAEPVVNGNFNNGSETAFDLISIYSYAYPANGEPAFYIDDVMASTSYIGP